MTQAVNLVLFYPTNLFSKSSDDGNNPLFIYSIECLRRQHIVTMRGYRKDISATFGIKSAMVYDDQFIPLNNCWHLWLENGLQNIKTQIGSSAE